MRNALIISGLAALLCAPMAMQAQDIVIYEQTFDTAASSADFEAAVVTANPNTQVPVNSVEFGFDYSTLLRPAITWADGDPTGSPIPEAPNTPGGATATRGLAVQVNIDADGAAAAATTINLFSTASYTGDYEVEVDAYYFFGGGSGSTEDVLVGMGHSGAASGVLRSALPFAGGTSDGIMYKHFGDADVGGPDHYLILGQDPMDYAAQPGTSWSVPGFDDVPGRDWNVGADPDFNAFIVGVMPGPYRAGTLTHTWATIRIRYQGGQARLFINDSLVATVAITGDLDGKIMLGAEDSFSGVNANNYMIFDNLVVREVVTVAATEENWNLYE